MNSLIIGMGQIGQAVKELISPYNHVETYDIATQNHHAPAHTDVMHICFPYSETFVKDVQDYITRYEPLFVVVYSTVPIGTCRAIGPSVVHSPVEGRHPRLIEGILSMPRWLGYQEAATENFFTEYFESCELEVTAVDNPDYTEALKLLSTAEYGINIAFADYKQEVAKSIGMDYGLTKQWNEDYNRLYWRMVMPQFQKFRLDPPNGKIGGHCVVPNAELLDAQFPSDLLKLITRLQ